MNCMNNIDKLLQLATIERLYEMINVLKEDSKKISTLENKSPDLKINNAEQYIEKEKFMNFVDEYNQEKDNINKSLNENTVKYSQFSENQEQIYNSRYNYLHKAMVSNKEEIKSITMAIKMIENKYDHHISELNEQINNQHKIIQNLMNNKVLSSCNKCDDNRTEIDPIPTADIPSVDGTKGITNIYLQERSGAYIDIVRDKGLGVLKDTASQCEPARDLISSFVEDCEENEIIIDKNDNKVKDNIQLIINESPSSHTHQTIDYEHTKEIEEMVEEEEEEEEMVEEEEEEMVEEEEEEMVEEEEEEEMVEEEEEEEEVFEIEIDDITYYATNEENGTLYEVLDDDEIGKQVGIIKNGEPIFS